MRNIKSDRIIVGVCFFVLVFFSVTIAARFLTRQLLIERFHMDNIITRMVWFDNSEARAVTGGESDERNRAVTGNELDESLCAAAGGESFGTAYTVSDEQKGLTDTDWAKKYPFEEDIRTVEGETGFLTRACSLSKSFTDMIFAVEGRIETYATDLLAGYYQWVMLAKEYNNLIGWAQAGTVLSPKDGDILYLDNGYLTYVQPFVDEKDINQIADNVAEFDDFLDARGIDFYYINAGSKVCPYDRQTLQTDLEFTNENGDHLLEALRGRNVETLDLRECMIKDGLDWYDSYYRTDHHWKTETGLWAAGVVSKLLNEKSGFAFDDFYFSRSSYRFENYEKYLLGGQGREVTFAGAEPEDYMKITPGFATDFSISIPTKGVEAKGTYSEVLFLEDSFANIARYTKEDFLTQKDAYHCAGIANDALTVIKNHNAEHNQDKKILMLQDSFSWYSTSFLACDVGEIDAIYVPAFTGSIRNYVSQTKPDVVIMMLCERNISPVEAEGEAAHTAMFDLR